MSRQIIDPNQSYTFSDYGKLNCEAIDLVEYFGYKLEKKVIDFPKPSIELPPEFWQEIENLMKLGSVGSVGGVGSVNLPCLPSLCLNTLVYYL